MKLKNMMAVIIFTATGILMAGEATATDRYGAVSAAPQDTSKAQKYAREIEVIDEAIAEVDKQIQNLKGQLASDSVKDDAELTASIESTITKLERARQELQNARDELANGGGKEPKSIVISDDGIHIKFKEREEKEIMTEADLPNVETDWFNFSLGINGLIENGSFPLSVANKALELEYLRSVNFNIAILQQGINIIRHKVYLTYGLGLSINDFRLANKNISIAPRTDTFAVIEEPIEFKKTKLAANYIELPVMLHFGSNPMEPNRSFEFAAGGYINMMYSSYQKQVSDDRGKVKLRDDYNLNQFNYGLTGQIGYGGTKFYVRYALTPFFEPKKGPNVYPVSLGLVIEGFDWN